ncbi:Alpha/Beta hydrolase protein [Peziza echinospora]|nr:Alpha/Beta hydrolase protein [Peziza echinospora]
MVHLSISAVVGFFALIAPTLIHAAPAAQSLPRAIDLGIYFELDTSALPLLKLPYATYRAATYDKSDDYYVFRNIRFAAPPVGDLRWRAPQAPLTQTGVQDGSVGNQCLQATPQQFAVGQPILEILEPGSEDCLFLDVWVPGKAVRGEVKDLPVLFWIFGGGYALGSKSFFIYDGSPLMRSAGMNMIYVAPNYRLGAFGWLGGPALYKTGDGLANAGLHDQRAALQWVQSYISLVGGSPAAVTAMGESAGAGSIMHHLVAKGGSQDPLFRSAILQSPAFEPQYDPGRLSGLYASFERAAGCEGKGVACLRSKSSDVLQAANKATINNSPYGTFGYGPSVDFDYIRDLPGIEMGRGNFYKGVKVIIGHNSNEGFLFANPAFDTEAEVTAMVTSNFPNATAAIRTQILNTLYPKPTLFSEFPSNFLRLSKIIEDVIVTCNTRWLAQAYAGNAYNYVFAIPPGIHGIDLLLTFWRTTLNIGALQLDATIPFLTNNNYATGFQSYLTSFVRTGDPNTHRQLLALPLTKSWATSSVTSEGVVGLELGLLGYSTTTDKDSSAARCDFWRNGAWKGA